jgi:ABC-2 type transport system permease protein
MESYGVTLKDGMVFEGDSTRYYQLPYMLLPKIGSHEITSPLSSGYYILYPQAQAIAQTGDASDTISITSLLSTTDSGYIKTDVQNMQSYDKESEDESGSFDLAVAIEDSDTNAQIVWFASALFSYSSYDEAVSGANTDLFLNSVSWMCQSESDITIHAKTISNEYLTVSSGTTALISLVGIGILPLLCIAIGIFVWISRKKR